MFRTALKDLWARKLRLLGTSVAVVLGVAFMCGTLVLTDTIGRTFDDLFADVNRDTDAVVRAEAVIEGEFGDARPRIDDSLVTLVAGVDGVARATGSVFGYAQIVGTDGEALGNANFGAPTFGGVWTDDELNPFTLAEGDAPVTQDEVVIDRKSAEDGDIAVGDVITVLTPDPIEVTVTGIATFGTLDSPGGASFVGMVQPAAQRYFGEAGKFDTVAVIAEDGVSQGEVRDRIAAALPEGHEAITGEELTQENQDAIAQGVGFFRTILLVFAAVALFVGSFIIYNTFGIIVAQRTRELALFRAIGASRRQVLRTVLLEATLVGVIASVLGLAAGIGVGALLKGLLSAAGMETPAGGVVVTANTVIVAFVVGVGIAVVSAYFPARRGSRVPPLAAMRDVAYERTTASRGRVFAGVVVLALGALTLFGGISGDGELALVGLGALGTLVGILILGPLIARPVTDALGAPLPVLKGMTGVLARQNASRNPKRTASTAAALMIGVTLVGFIIVFASSAQKSINRVIDDRFFADVIIEGAGAFGGGGFSPQLAKDVRDLDEVERVAAMRFARAKVEETSTALFGFSESAGEMFDLGVVEGSTRGMGTDGIGINTDYAEENDLQLGDTVTIQFVEGGPQEYEVKVIYTDQVLAGSYYVDTLAFDRFAPEQIDFTVFVEAREGVSADELLPVIDAAAEPYPTAEIQDIAEYKESQAAQFQVLLNLIYGLLLLAIFIALLGIANTLSLSIHERTRELGLLRAVGMTRTQVRSAVRWEAVLMALLGTTLGLGIGLFFGWAMSRAIRSEGLTEFSIPFGQLAVVCVLAAVAGVLAAVWPARRAARLNILDAIASE